jgi:hypothetical protein
MHVVEIYLRLGTKYHMKEFRTQAVKRLSYEFPATLEEVDAMDNYSRIDRCTPYVDEIFTVINLGRSCNLPRVLPWAFTAACELVSIKDIFRETGPTLSREDQQICMVGWRRLLKKQRVTTFGWLTTGNDACSVSSCRSARHKLLVSRLLPSKYPSGIDLECMPLAGWQAEWEENVCGRCTTVARASHQTGRQKMWDALPSIFDLPEWEELIKP